MLHPLMLLAFWCIRWLLVSMFTFPSSRVTACYSPFNFNDIGTLTGPFVWYPCSAAGERPNRASRWLKKYDLSDFECEIVADARQTWFEDFRNC